MTRILLSVFLLLIAQTIKAQPPLPDMLGVTQNGMNVITWVSQYDGIKSIAMQRSPDSVHNFATIGYVKSLKKGAQAYIDGHPNPGDNWYRLYIVFTSDVTWYSNSLKMHVDSASLLKQPVLPPNDSLQKFASKVQIGVPGENSGAAVVTDNTPVLTPQDNPLASAAKPIIKKTEPSKPTVVSTNSNVVAPVIRIPNISGSGSEAYTYIKSQYVFTNPFTGHINVEVPEARRHTYSIEFFDQKNKRVLEVPRISENSIIIDKRNFQHKGVFRFELTKDKERLESGYITIY